MRLEVSVYPISCQSVDALTPDTQSFEKHTYQRMLTSKNPDNTTR